MVDRLAGRPWWFLVDLPAGVIARGLFLLLGVSDHGSSSGGPETKDDHLLDRRDRDVWNSIDEKRQEERENEQEKNDPR